MSEISLTVTQLCVKPSAFTMKDKCLLFSLFFSPLSHGKLFLLYFSLHLLSQTPAIHEMFWEQWKGSQQSSLVKYFSTHILEIGCLCHTKHGFC